MIFKRVFNWDEALDEILPRDFRWPMTRVSDLAEFIMAPDHSGIDVHNTSASELLSNPISVAQWYIRDTLNYDSEYPFAMTLQSWILSVPEVQYVAHALSSPGTSLAHEIALCAAALVRKGAA